MRGTLVSFFAWFEKPCREEIDRCLACCRCFVRWVVSPFNSLAHVRSWFWCAVVDVVDALARVLPVFRVCMYAGGDAIVLLNFSAALARAYLLYPWRFPCMANPTFVRGTWPTSFFPSSVWPLDHRRVVGTFSQAGAGGQPVRQASSCWGRMVCFSDNLWS